MPRTLFDIDSVVRNCDRAAHVDEPALFLHDRAATQIKERLNEVNRRFKKSAIITGFPDFWAKQFPDAACFLQSEDLKLDPAQYDLIIHVYGMHCSNDPVGQMIQCRRALVPDGLFLGVLFGGSTLNELRRVLSEAEINLTGGLRPRVAPMAEIRDLGGLLQRAGLALPVADNDLTQVSYPSLVALMHDLRNMGEANALCDRKKTFSSRQLFDRASDLYINHFSDKDNRLLASFDTIYLTGWAPSETQPKPLKPGSATRSLADVLDQLAPAEKT